MSQPDEKTELITPKKLNNPMKDSKSYRDLHRELVFIQKRGVVLQNKPELQQVMEQRKYNLLREQEKAKQTKTDFEEVLKKKYQKLEQLSFSWTQVTWPHLSSLHDTFHPYPSTSASHMGAITRSNSSLSSWFGMVRKSSLLE
ncbi:protein FAM107B-like [Chiloscyllium punctatum]|uniref:protein FAM107B-like n=1 Tax=Chiloscyllium punctatum TaxID=137246 RepID=UPI003B632E72